MNKKLIEHKPIACHGEMWRRIIQPMEERIEYEKRETGLVQCFDPIEECFSFIESRI